jgi:hypothetical protein
MVTPPMVDVMFSGALAKPTPVIVAPVIVVVLVLLVAVPKIVSMLPRKLLKLLLKRLLIVFDVLVLAEEEVCVLDGTLELAELTTCELLLLTEAPVPVVMEKVA